MSRNLRWGILGTASITRRRFMPAMHKCRNAEAVAIGSREPARAQEMAAELNIPVPCGSYEELLADPNIEAVYVPLPNHLHCEWTIKALDAGKHVLCEKPMAVGADEAQRMADAARRNGVHLMEGFMYRLNPRTLAVKKAVEDGMIGELRTAVIQFSFTIGSLADSRMIPGKGAGAIPDLGCYCINFARYIFGAEPISVTANQHIHAESGGDLSTCAILDFGEGRAAMINCSFETAYRNSICLAGTAKLLKAEKFFTPLNDGKISFTTEGSFGEDETFEFDAVDQFLLEIEHFSESVLNNTPPLLDPATDALGNARVIDAIRQSAAQSQVIYLKS